MFMQLQKKGLYISPTTSKIVFANAIFCKSQLDHVKAIVISLGDEPRTFYAILTH